MCSSSFCLYSFQIISAAFSFPEGLCLNQIQCWYFSWRSFCFSKFYKRNKCESFPSLSITFIQNKSACQDRRLWGGKGGGAAMLWIVFLQLVLLSNNCSCKTKDHFRTPETDRQSPTERDNYNHILEIKQFELHLFWSLLKFPSSFI